MLPADAPARTDLQLAVIGISLLGGLLAALLSPLSLVVGGGVGSLLASVAVLDGIAFHPPGEEEEAGE